MHFNSEILVPLYLLRDVGTEKGVIYDEIFITLYTNTDGYSLTRVKVVRAPIVLPSEEFRSYEVCREQNGHGRVGLRIAGEIRVPSVGLLLPPNSFELFHPIAANKRHLLINWLRQLNAETGQQI